MTKPISKRLCRSVGDASDFLKSMANANRLAIVCHLMEGEACVSAMEAELGIRQPTLSQQLTALREAGILATRRDGKAVLYSVADRKARVLVDLLRDLFAGLDDVTGRSGMARPSLDEMMFD